MLMTKKQPENLFTKDHTGQTAESFYQNMISSAFAYYPMGLNFYPGDSFDRTSSGIFQVGRRILVSCPEFDGKATENSERFVYSRRLREYA